ncbi:MAG: hypothetical protein QXI50_02470, partial [Candidatus Caldarchaeum sp.]
MRQAYVLMTAAGLAVFDENLGYMGLKPFADKPEVIARVIASGRAPQDYVDRFLEEVKGMGFDELLYWDERVGEMLRAGAEMRGLRLKAVDRLTLDVEQAMSEAEAEKYRDLVRDVSTELARMKIMTEAERRDLHIVHAVRALDDLEK